MSNDLMTATNADNSAVVFAGGNNPFIDYTKREGVTDGVYARFNGNDGKFVTNDVEIEVDSEVIFELMNCKLCWQGFDTDNRPHKGPEVALVSGKALPEPDRTNKTIKWTKMIRVGIITMDGKQMIYSAKADKPGRGINKLLSKFGAEIARQRQADGSYNVPVIRMGARPFQITVKQEETVNGEKIEREVKMTKYAEDFQIVSWVTRAEVNAIISADNDAEDSEREMVDVTPKAEVVQEVIPPTKPAMPRAGTPFRRGATK